MRYSCKETKEFTLTTGYLGNLSMHVPNQLRVSVQRTSSVGANTSISDVCPLHEVFNEDDRKASNCIPHPLQMLKCIRQSGLSVQI
jgi:hypothetical protein